MAKPPPGGLSEAAAFKIIFCPLKMTAAKSRRAQNRLGQTRCPPFPRSLPPTTSRTHHDLTPQLFHIRVFLSLNIKSDPASLQEQRMLCGVSENDHDKLA